MKETIKLGVILLIITAVSAGVLAVSNNLTKDKIAQIEMEGSLGAITELFESADKFEELDQAELSAIIDSNPTVVEIFEAYEGDDVTGYAIKTIAGGFGGDVVMVTGFSKDGSITGIRLLEHSETAGIGSRAGEPEFTDLFIDKPADEEVVVEALSGATITSKAVILGVNNAREVFNTQLAN